MNIVICTGIGFVLLALYLAVTGGLLYGACWTTEYVAVHFTVPNWVKTTFLAAIVVIIVIGILLSSHAMGCKVIHFAMGHR